MEWKRWLKGTLPFVMLMGAACGGKDPVCGNNIQETSEKLGIIEFCDDGNLTAGDGCDDKCFIEFNATDHRCELPAGFQNGFGGCCNAQADCLSGNCSFGFCDLPGQASCTQDADCTNAAAADAAFTNASPFAPGTTFKCVTTLQDSNLLAPIGLCLPGSGTACDNPADGRCPAGETCSLTFDLSGSDQTTNFLGGVCTTDYSGSKRPGSFCSGDDSAPYECSSGIFFLNCIANTCMEACDGADPNGSDACSGAGFECLGPLTGVDLFGDNDPTNDVGGAGFCVGNACGQVTISSQGDDSAIDLSLCPADFGCAFFGSFADPDLLTYQCIPNDPNGAGLGGACEQDTFFGQNCTGGNICLQAQPAENAGGQACSNTFDCCPDGPTGCTVSCQDDNGDGNGHCTNRGEAGTCAPVCENHDSCNTDPNIPATCIDLAIDPDNNINLPACMVLADSANFFQGGLNFCTKEADCTTAGEGCIAAALAGIGDRAGLGICGDFVTVAGVTEKAEGEACNFVDFAAGGTACTTDAQCSAANNEVCIDDGTGGKCRPQITECLSAICADANLDFRVSSDPAALDITATQTFCTSYCITDADCSANMECNPVLTEDNVGGNIQGQSNSVGLCMPVANPLAADNCTVDNTGSQHNSCEVDAAAGSNLVCTDDTTCALAGELCFNGTCHTPIVGGGDSCNIVPNTGDCFTTGAGAGTTCDGDEDCDLGGSCVGADEVAGTNGFCIFNGCDSTKDGTAAGCAADNEICLGNGSAAPGSCILSCTIANGNADCTAVNAALTCQDVGIGGGVGLCDLP